MNESPVVRGGVPVIDNWQIAAEDAFYDDGEAVLSVNADNRAEGETELELLARISRDAGFPHNKVVCTTAGKIRDLGHELVHDVSNGQALNHFHIVFSEVPTTVVIQELVDVFSKPFPNPGK